MTRIVLAGCRATFIRLFVTLVLFIGTWAEAQEDRTVVVGYEQFPPYTFTDDSGAPAGYSIELIRFLMEQTGYNVEFIALQNPAEALEMLAAGTIDMTTLLAKTSQRRALGTFTRSIGSYQTAVFVTRDSPLQTLADLDGVEVGGVAGSFAIHSIETVKGAIPVPFDDSDAMITPLMVGGVAAVVAPEETFWSRLRIVGIESSVRTFDTPIMRVERGFLLHRDRQELLADLNRAIETQLTDNYLRSLKEKWFGRNAGLIDNWLFPWMAVVVIASAALIISLAHLAWRSTRRERRVRAQYEAERLFLEAMDRIDASIVIFDRDLNAKVWNRGFQSAFPEAAAIIRRGEPMSNILNVAGVPYGDDYFSEAPKARISTEAIIGRMLSGQDTTRLIKLENGRVFEAYEFGIGYDHYAAVRVDVTGMNSQANKIREQREELKHVNDKLHIFSTVAAHDLRAPVMQMDALLEFVVEDLEDAALDIPPEAEMNLALIRQITTRMSNLVEDLLVYARSDATSEAVEPIYPSERLREVTLLAAVPDGFEVSIAKDIPVVHLPPIEFDTVFRNMIANAVKHHDSATGSVSVRGWREDQSFVFEVEDDGPGIPKDSLEEIFDPFKRLSSTTETSGSGLGLSFIRKCVRSWGGEVSALSPNDRGTIFRIRVPDRQTGADDAPASQTDVGFDATHPGRRMAM